MQAIFVGGPFDLTKKIVEFEQNFIYFFEPIKAEDLYAKNNDIDVYGCEQLIYKLTYRTPNNVLIYEYEGYK